LTNRPASRAYGPQIGDGKVRFWHLRDFRARTREIVKKQEEGRLPLFTVCRLVIWWHLPKGGFPDMRLRILIKSDGVKLLCGDLLAWLPIPAVGFAHLGCKVLGMLEGVPSDLAEQWDAKFGERKNWASKRDVRQRLAKSLASTATSAQVDEVVLLKWLGQRRSALERNYLLTLSQ